MALTVNLTLPKTSILYQEDLECTLVLENKGPSPLQIIPALMAVNWPVVKLIDLNTGKETLYETQTHPQDMSGPPPWTDLGPGQQSALSFLLKGKIPDLKPGLYEISVIYDYNQGEQTAESSPVRLEVKPSTPHNLFLASALGGASNSHYAAWINLDKGNAQVVWGHLELIPGGGVRTVGIVEQASVRSEPVLSVPDNGQTAPGQWVAWVDSGQLCFHFFSPGTPALPPIKVPLNNNEAKIVGPIHWKPSDKTAPDLASGEALVLLGSFPNVQFQSLLLNGSTAQSGGAALVPGGRMPAWIQNTFLSGGGQLAPYALAEPGKIDLALLTWGHQNPMTSKPLCSWQGDFLAAACVMDETDKVHGGVLMWAGKADDTKELSLIPWTLAPDGRFSQGSPMKIKWESTATIARAQISVNPKGQFAAVVLKDDGAWDFISPAGKVSPLAGEFAKTDQALAVGFLTMIKPVLIGGTRSNGLKITGPDGSPIPPLK